MDADPGVRMTAELAGLFYRLEGRRSHYFVHFGGGAVAAALVDTRDSLEQIQRTVLGWLDPASGVPLVITGERLAFTIERETLHNDYAGELVEPDVLQLRTRSRRPGMAWTHWGGDATYARLAWPAPIDLNTATATELRQLPGVTALRARQLLEHRGRVGRLTVAQLGDVPGFGPKLRAALARWITDDAPDIE